MQSNDNLAEAKTAKAVDAIADLTPDQKIDFAQDFMDVVKTPKQRMDVAEAVVNRLTPEQQKNLAESLVGKPTQGITDYLWAVSVTSFALVLLGVSAGVLVGVIWLGKTADNVQPALTIFTAVVGFLGGLFVPSPVDSSKKTPQR